MEQESGASSGPSTQWSHFCMIHKVSVEFRQWNAGNSTRHPPGWLQPGLVLSHSQVVSYSILQDQLGPQIMVWPHLIYKNCHLRLPEDKSLKHAIKRVIGEMWMFEHKPHVWGYKNGYIWLHQSKMMECYVELNLKLVKGSNETRKYLWSYN